jgi:hypothetical protein
MHSTRGPTDSDDDEVRVMIRFLLRRTIHGILLIWVISMLVFGLFFLAPGDIARRMAGRQATPEMVALIRHRLGLDQPIAQQYGNFVWRALHGDLGYDYYLAEDALAGARRCCAVDGLGPVQRDRLGSTTAVADRPFAHAILVDLLLDA